MAGKAAKKTAEKTQEPVKEKEIVFKCKFCGETKPISDLVVMRQYFPQMSACQVCARGVRDSEKPA